ncbi:MAG: alpha/beta hydrolase-fold protein [Bacteroidota bacterium]
MNRLICLLLCLAGTLSTQAQLTLIVDALPANTPTTDPIHIAGNFQNWNPGDTNYELSYDSLQQHHRITLPQGVTSIVYKFTRGSWSTVESDANGGFRPDRTYTGNDGDTIRLQILGWEDLNGGGGSGSTAADNVTVMSASFFMPQLNRNRKVWVYLPPDYDTSGADYPVLYMHDGQNIFDASTSFAGEWEVDETLNALHALGDPGIIVVAVDNGGVHRTAEYTPWPNSQYGGGDGAKYAEFLVQTLKPHIDSTYRTLPDREHTGIMGSSLGGLISTYAGIEYQDVFGKVGIFSPSYWFNSQSYTHVATTGRQQPMKMYQLGGGLESGNVVGNIYRMQDTMLAAGFGPLEIKSVDVPNGQHSEWFWAQEFEAAYIWLFRTQTTGIEEGVRTLTQAQIAPNPLSGQLNLSFSLRKRTPLKIEILDMQGRIQMVLWDDAMKAGGHQPTFDLSKGGLAEGMYICRISTPRDTHTVSFILR